MSRHAARVVRDHCLAPERVDAPISGVDPEWTATLPARHAGAFGLADILVPCD
jgi:hypothetical protein